MSTSVQRQGRIENAAQLRAAKARRSELEEQIHSLSSRRGQLVQERLNSQAAGNPGVVREVEAQIAEYSTRLARTEREKLATDDAIMDAVSRGVTSSEEVVVEIPGVPGVPIPPIPPIPEVGIHIPPFEQTGLQGRDAARIIGINAVVLLLIGVFAWRAIRRSQRLHPRGEQSVDKLSQAVDAIAVEVERISENQRYITKMMAERLEIGQGTKEPVETKRQG